LPISVNKKAIKLVQDAMSRPEEFGLTIFKDSSGATIIDAGIKAVGGYSAGRLVTEICMGNLGKANITYMDYEGLKLPSIFVDTDYPAISTLGAQFAGWRIKTEKYFAMGSGPARALALKPKELYQKIAYEDDSDEAVLVLETDAYPPLEALAYIAKECEVQAQNLYVLVAPTSSLAGSVQISGRIVEAGIHKLTEIGFDPKKILYGCGYAPIAPIHPKSAKAMGRTNDALYYGGFTYYTVDFEDDLKLKEIVAKAPSSTARDYGKPFYEIFKAANFDFYQVDPNLFAPAVFAVNNIRSGVTYTAGKMNLSVLRQTMGLTES